MEQVNWVNSHKLRLETKEIYRNSSVKVGWPVTIIFGCSYWINVDIHLKSFRYLIYNYLYIKKYLCVSWSWEGQVGIWWNSIEVAGKSPKGSRLKKMSQWTSLWSMIPLITGNQLTVGLGDPPSLIMGLGCLFCCCILDWPLFFFRDASSHSSMGWKKCLVGYELYV